MTIGTSAGKPSVALLGLGTMGRGMAANLLKAGLPLTVWNRTAAKSKHLADSGAAVAETPAQAVSTAEIVLAMLSDDAASRAAWLEQDGALTAMKTGAIAVECSTLSPEWIHELYGAVDERGLRMAESPVTGSRIQAEAGQLKFLVGADEDTFTTISPILRCMGNEILHLGPVGSGGQLKLINNFLCAVQVASFAEALAWIERTGLNLHTALDFLKRGAPGSGIVSAMSERMTNRNYDVNFLLRLMAKDQRYAKAAAAQLGVDLTMASASEKLFRQAEQQGLGEKDMSAVVEAIRRASDAAGKTK
ncbi:MAG: NAD(P)-dependent oxidoreductase [Acidobacteria bacterium]|nr:NAD(P)-dependent oxidoreductase [Acidobacteriota bacterium]